MKSILDPSFRYVPSSATDLRKTFARVRREMRKPPPPPPAREAPVDVVAFPRFERSKNVASRR